MENRVTARQAGALVRRFLAQNDLGHVAVTARAVSFSDLARRQRVFVQVNGSVPASVWQALKEFSQQRGFYVE